MPTPFTHNKHWAERDLKVVWHPCTQMKDHEHMPIIPIQRGKGVWLYDFDGKAYLDAISSWWVNVFGHANPRIGNKIAQQLSSLEHVLLAGFSHPGVIELSERLLALAPQRLGKVFYADNGSSGIEVALKMSHHFWINMKRPEKKRFVTLSNSYHGETLGALSVSDVPLFTHTYEALLHPSIHVPSPDCYHRAEGVSWETHTAQMFAHMETCLETHKDQIAAVIIEPLVQGAGGMRMYHPIYLKLLGEACQRHGVHLIVDEIATGFGRTGTFFACEQGPVTPDFLVISKALTGGYLPMAAVLTSQNIYDAFYDDYNHLTGFMHSHTYTGNPLACAAALATLDIFEEDNVIQENVSLIEQLRLKTQGLQLHPHVSEVRQTGSIVAVELIADKSTRLAYPWQERRGLLAYQYALSRGVLLRPLGSVLYLVPPYVISDEELSLLVDVLFEAIQFATREPINTLFCATSNMSDLKVPPHFNPSISG